MTAEAQSHALRQEAKLLFAASSPDRDPELLTELLSGPLDEAYLLEVATKSRVVTLVHRAIREVEFEGGLDSVRQVGRHFAWRTLQMTRDLIEIVSAGADRGIEMLPYKGSALAAQYYPDLSDRMFKDIDILTRRRDVEGAIEVLTSLGYRLQDDLGSGGLERAIQKDCELHFRRSDGGALVELHWHVLPPPYSRQVDIDGLLDRLVPLDLLGTPTRGFSAEDYMLLLSIHGGEKHAWKRLQMIADVAHLVHHRPDLDWPSILERSRQLGHELHVLEGVFMAWAFLGVAPPSDVLARATNRNSVSHRAASVLGYLFRPGFGLPGRDEWLRYHRHVSAVARERGNPLGDDRAGTLAYLRQAFRLSWADRSVALPYPLTFLYYFYRPVRLFVRHRAALLKRI